MPEPPRVVGPGARCRKKGIRKLAGRYPISWTAAQDDLGTRRSAVSSLAMERIGDRGTAEGRRPPFP